MNRRRHDIEPENTALVKLIWWVVAITTICILGAAMQTQAADANTLSTGTRNAVKLYKIGTVADSTACYGATRLTLSDGSVFCLVDTKAVTPATSKLNAWRKVPAANRAPLISGTPPASGQVGALYSFTPTANDPDGDVLSFSMESTPPGGTISSATGKFAWTPNAAGVRSQMAIIAKDPQGLSARLAFGSVTIASAPGSVTLSWDAPTQNTDGSTLTDLAGYTLYQGTSATALSELAQVQASTTSYIVNALTTGTYYWAVSARNTGGAESVKSASVSKRVP